MSEVKTELTAEGAAKAKGLRGVNLKPGKLSACREGTKQAALVDLLARPEGATFAELHAAMNAPKFKHLKPWVENTTKAALSWDVHKTKGYGIGTTFEFAGVLRTAGRKVTGRAEEPVAVYRLVYPRGASAPLPHTPRKAPAKSAEPAKRPRKARTRKAKAATPETAKETAKAA